MIRLYKKMGWFFKQEAKVYLFMLLLLIFLAFFTMVPATVLGKAIDIVSTGSLTKPILLGLFLLLLAIPVLRYLFDYLYHYTINKEGQKLSYQLRKKYLDHLFEMDSMLFEEFTKGDLISRVTADLEAITLSMTSLLQEVVYQSGLLIFALSAMAFTISWELTLISATILPIGLVILNKIRIKKRGYYETHKKIYSKMTEKVLETVEGVKVIRAYVAEEQDLKVVNETIKADIDSWKKISMFEMWFGPLFDLVYSISYFLAFLFGTLFVINNKITPGQLVTFVMYIGMLSGPIITLSTVLNTASTASVACDRYYEILNKKPNVSDNSDSKEIFTFNKIDFNNVTFKYPFDKNPVIKNITFSIKKGETIGIVGPTGAGKSTLIRQLLREFNVTDGSVLLDDDEISNYKIEDVRNLVGYVPQSHILFKKSVDENILVGKPEAVATELQQAIKIADFSKDINFLHEGLNTIVGEQGATLSGGQKQRLSIARALVKNPDILILDDSLSAVDAKTEETIINHLKEYRQNKTNIIVAHRFSAILSADKIIVLEDGKISQLGNHRELLSQDGWYKRQFIIQSPDTEVVK
ncbi:MAG: ABC transporter ATP-binding protein [bacterium]